MRYDPTSLCATKEIMANLISSSRIIIVLLALVVLRPGVFAQCYYPGGSVATDQYPCDKFAYITLCCPLGYTCFSNSLCVVTDGTIAKAPLNTVSRGTCTNPLWNNAICGSFCLSDGNNGSLQSCGNGNWCCNREAANGICDCKNDRGTFSIADGIAQTIIGVSSMKSTSTDFSLASSTAASRSVISSKGSTSTSVPSTSRSASISGSTSAQTTQSRSTSTSSQSSSSSSQTAASQTSPPPAIAITHTTAFKAGISVAVIIVAALIFGIVGFCLWRRRQRKRAAESPGPFDEYRDSFHVSQGGTSAPRLTMQDSHPYQPDTSSAFQRGPSRNSDLSGRISPPADPPYQIPPRYQHLRPYEGT